MSAFQFIIGDTWLITGTLKDSSGTPLPPTSVVEVTVATPTPIVRTSAAGEGVTWVNEAEGVVQIVVRPEDQPADLVEGVYDFQVRATLPSGVVTTQEWGTITALRSL